jgi:hypothetical protein
MNKIARLTLLFVFVLAACAPAATPMPPPTVETAPVDSASATSPAVVTVDMFYTFINIAANKDELANSWAMLTNEAQCGAFYKCELTTFQTHWEKSMALYRLYSCDDKTVIAQEMEYPRDSVAPADITDGKYWSYEVIESSNGLMMISKIRVAQEPGSGCSLILDRVANP